MKKLLWVIMSFLLSWFIYIFYLNVKSPPFLPFYFMYLYCSEIEILKGQMPKALSPWLLSNKTISFWPFLFFFSP